jgi:hypothetical protein
MAFSSSAQSSAVRHRAALVERGSEGDHAEARHAAVGRLDAGDAAERGRLADRAAGVGGGGAGARRAATAAAEPPEEPPGTAVLSHGFLTGPKAEFSFDEPIANSSQLSLPSVTMPAGGIFDHGGVERADVVGQHLRAGGRTPVARDENVLVGDRHAGQRVASPRPGGRRPRGPVPASALVDVQEGVEVAGLFDTRRGNGVPVRWPTPVCDCSSADSSLMVLVCMDHRGFRPGLIR